MNEAIADNINANGGKNTIIVTLPRTPKVLIKNQESNIQDESFSISSNRPVSALKKKKVIFKADLANDDNELKNNYSESFQKLCFSDNEENKLYLQPIKAIEEDIDLTDILEDRLSDELSSLASLDKMKLQLKNNSTSSYYKTYYAKMNDKLSKFKNN